MKRDPAIAALATKNQPFRYNYQCELALPLQPAGSRCVGGLGRVSHGSRSAGDMHLAHHG